MFLGSSIQSWLVTLFFAGVAVMLARVAWTIVQQDRRRAAAKASYYADGDAADAASATGADDATVGPDGPGFRQSTAKTNEKDAWDSYFPSGKFMRSWYLNMDVIEEGVTALGSRYRILRDNDTGVLYYADRNGMSVIVKDYQRTRYA